MVGRKWKSYALLSVTIVLSFSLLLGYLTFSDSAIYNENKELFSYRRQDLQYGQKIPLRVAGYCKNYTIEMWKYTQQKFPESADENMFRIFLSNKFIDYAQLDKG